MRINQIVRDFVGVSLDKTGDMLEVTDSENGLLLFRLYRDATGKIQVENLIELRKGKL